VDAADARRALAERGLTFTSVEPVAEQGWASWTFEVDGQLIAQFPRNDAIAAAHAREQRLLPALAEHVSFRIPVPLHPEVFVYEKVPGRGFRRGDDFDGVRAMIAELHSFPVEEARRLIGRPPIEEEYAIEWSMFSAEAFPHLDDALVEAVSFIKTAPALERESLIHNDLGMEHLIVDDAGAPVGIIDFEDVTIGDPDVDLMPLHVAVGRPLTESMWRYHCRSVLHDIVYVQREGRAEEIPAMVTELRRRLDLRPGQ
jgi:aminoglycoside phosphotransferase (APT) family kinase protein